MVTLIKNYRKSHFFNFFLIFLRIDRFNYRATAYMVQHGFYEFLNWFDERAWYPLGKNTDMTCHLPKHKNVCKIDVVIVNLI